MSERSIAVACADPRLAADAERVAAAAGLAVTRCHGSAELLSSWRRADVLVIDRGSADQAVAARLPARESVILVHEQSEPAVWRLAADAGVASVVSLPAGEALLAELLGGARARQARARVVAVIGCGSGCGATTLAALTALQAAAGGAMTCLIDGDRFGGGVDLLLGAEALDGARWEDVVGPGSAGAATATPLSWLPTVRGMHFLTWPRRQLQRISAGEVAGCLGSISEECDLVVIDLPRSTDDVVTALLAGADTAVLVVSRQVRSVMAARAVCDWVGMAAELVCIATSVPRAEIAAADVATTLGVPLIGSVEVDDRVAKAVTAGDVGALTGRSVGVATALARRLTTPSVAAA